MDRDLLRIILLIAGLVLVLGLYFWGKYKEYKTESKTSAYDEDEFEDERYSFSLNPVDEAEEKIIHNPPMSRANLSSAPQTDSNELNESGYFIEDSGSPTEPKADEVAPVEPLDLVQFLIVPRIADGFAGIDIEQAANEAHLSVSKDGVFQLYRNDRAVISAVSMVEPGVFPIGGMESYQTPGLVLFFQPGEVPKPRQTLIDLVDTCFLLADRLEGFTLDRNWDPLTKESITQLRDRLPVSD